MEDVRVGDEKLLVAGSDKRCGKKYIEDYNICQRIKNRTEVLARKLKLSKVLEKL